MLESGGRGPRFGPNSRAASEIPIFVIHVYGRNLFRRKRNLFKSSDFDDATFAGNNLVEISTVAESYRHHLITYACLSGPLQVIDKPARYCN